MVVGGESAGDAGRRRLRDEIDLSGMDPAARRFLTMVALGGRERGAVPIETRRRSFEKLMAFSKPPAGNMQTMDRALSTCVGDIPVRVYAGGEEGPAPGLIFFHGGGLVAGSLGTHDALCRTLARDAGCTLVAVGYRLAPEHPFPAAIFDALAACRHVLRRPSDFGLDPQRIAVGGDSGGASLATIAARAMPRRLRAQILLCPVLDASGERDSRRRYGDGFLLDVATMAEDLAHYAPYRRLDDPTVSPLRAASFAGLPPTVIHSAGFDPLRDEAELYAKLLQAENVPVAFTCHAAMIHHFYGLTGVIPAARTALAAIADDIRVALGSTRHGRPSSC